MAKTYDTYKDSGIAWIDMIPKGWKALPFKSIFYTEKGLNITKADLTETGVPVLSYGQIHSKQNTGTCLNEELFKFVPRSYLKTNPECLVQKGCLLIADTSEDYEGCGNAIYVDSNKTLFAGYHTIIARPYNIGRDYKYFAYLLLTDNWRQQVRSCVSGIKVYSVNQKILKQTSVLFPPLPEQEAIATYLDEKCGEIDSLISLQEEMISELQAYKKSVITEAVTKGLDPNVPMKDSGVEWIGMIPEIWKLARIGNFFRLRTERNTKPMEEVQLLSLYTGIGVFPHGEQEERGNKAVTVDGYKIVHKNDIIVNIILAWMGAIGVSNYDGVTSPAYDIYIPNLARVVPHYFHYVFRTKGFAGECYKYGRGIMMMRWRTYSTEFKQISIPLPPLSEQQAIASYLDEKTSQIDALIAIKQEKITELKDYKMSIIYEYVTGKKKV